MEVEAASQKGSSLSQVLEPGIQDKAGTGGAGREEAYFSQWGQREGEGTHVNGGVGDAQGEGKGVTAGSSVCLERGGESGKSAVIQVGTCFNYIRTL